MRTSTAPIYYASVPSYLSQKEIAEVRRILDDLRKSDGRPVVIAMPAGVELRVICPPRPSSRRSFFALCLNHLEYEDARSGCLGCRREAEGGIVSKHTVGRFGPGSHHPDDECRPIEGRTCCDSES